MRAFAPLPCSAGKQEIAAEQKFQTIDCQPTCWQSVLRPIIRNSLVKYPPAELTPKLYPH